MLQTVSPFDPNRCYVCVTRVRAAPILFFALDELTYLTGNGNSPGGDDMGRDLSVMYLGNPRQSRGYCTASNIFPKGNNRPA